MKKKLKKYKKAVTGIAAGTGVAAGGALALGGLGGASAAAGQRAMAGVTRVLPTAGKVIGAGFLLRTLECLTGKKKKRRY